MQSLLFEERTLKPYAEPVTVEKLKEGEVYFTIQFSASDRDGLFPIMETLVFSGFNLDEKMFSYASSRTWSPIKRVLGMGKRPQNLKPFFTHKNLGT